MKNKKTTSLLLLSVFCLLAVFCPALFTHAAEITTSPVNQSLDANIASTNNTAGSLKTNQNNNSIVAPIRMLADTACITASGQSGTISSSSKDCVPVLDDGSAHDAGLSSTTTTETQTGLIPCGNGSSPADACTLCDFIIGFKRLIDFGTKILVALTVTGIFISGIMYIISAGSQLTEQAKKFLSASLIGFTIVMTAWLIVNVTMWVLSFDPAMTINHVDWYTFDCNDIPGTANGPF